MIKLICVLTVLWSTFVFAESEAPAPAPSGEKISTTRYVVGGIIGTYPGLGFGHLVQGRWRERGWIFLVGEVASAAVFTAGVMNCALESAFSGSSTCRDNAQMVIGELGFLGFKVWEIVDVWATPPRDHRIAGRDGSSAAQMRVGLIPQGHDRPTLFALNFQF